MNTWVRVVQRIPIEAKEAHSQPLLISYELEGAGWAKCSLQSDVGAVQITSSYLSDSLRDLVLSALSVLGGFRGVDFSFDEEPGQYRWVIESTGETTIDLQLFEFPDLGSNEPNDKGSRLFLVHTNRTIYAQAVLTAASAVLAKHGLAGYLESWHKHPFPARELELLQEALAALDRGA
jgi:hypothetical protein